MPLVFEYLEKGCVARPAALTVLFLLAFWTDPPAVSAAADAPPPGSVHVGEFTTGGCVHVCETLAMCKDAYINEKNGDCWLVLDRKHADFINLVKSCPRAEGRTFSAEMSGGTWRLACVSGAAASDGKEETGSGASPGSGGLEKLPDIKPF